MSMVYQAFVRAFADMFTSTIVRATFFPALFTAFLLLAFGFIAWDLLLTTLNTWVLEQEGQLPLMASWIGAWIVPLLLMWLALPLMVLLSLFIAGFFVIPMIAKRVGALYYPELQRQNQMNFGKAFVWFCKTFLWALLFWLLLLPLFATPIGWLGSWAIWAWVSYRLISFDVFAEFASVEETTKLIQQNKFSLFVIGVAAGVLTFLPSVLWFTSLFSMLLAPVAVLFSVWLQLMIFAAVSLWFSHFCLQALVYLRQQQQPKQAPITIDTVATK